MVYPSQKIYEQMDPLINRGLSEQGVFQTENRVRRKDATLLWCLVSGRAIDRHDLARGTIWTIADITQRKETEAEVLQTGVVRHQRPIPILLFNFFATFLAFPLRPLRLRRWV
jgi:hypothetical protein